VKARARFLQAHFVELDLTTRGADMVCEIVAADACGEAAPMASAHTAVASMRRMETRVAPKVRSFMMDSRGAQHLFVDRAVSLGTVASGIHRAIALAHHVFV
jgi:hypothetical protein